MKNYILCSTSLLQWLLMYLGLMSLFELDACKASNLIGYLCCDFVDFIIISWLPVKSVLPGVSISVNLVGLDNSISSTVANHEMGQSWKSTKNSVLLQLFTGWLELTFFPVGLVSCIEITFIWVNSICHHDYNSNIFILPQSCGKARNIRRWMGQKNWGIIINWEHSKLIIFRSLYMLLTFTS